MKKLIIASTALALGMSGPAFAKFATVSTQGNSGKSAKEGATNSGLQTTTGPKGQVKQGKAANTTVTGPGNSTKMP